MRSDEAPCKGCADRHTACHDHCVRYAEWRLALHKMKDQYKEYKRQKYEEWLRSEQRLSEVEKWRDRKKHGRK